MDEQVKREQEAAEAAAKAAAGGEAGGEAGGAGGEAGGAGSGAGGEAGGAGGDAGGKKGDLGKALKQERGQRREETELRKSIEEENARLRKRLEALSGGAPEVKPVTLDVADDDLIDGGLVKKILAAQREETMRLVQQMMGGRTQVDELMAAVDEFPVFRDEKVGGLARMALGSALDGVKDLAAVRPTIERVAQEASRLVADVANGVSRRGVEGARTFAPSSGTETASHVKVDEAPKSFDEASQQAKSRVVDIARNLRARLGM